MCLVTQKSRFTQRLMSMMQSSSPLSYMAARHGSHTDVISGTGFFSHQTSPVNSWTSLWHKVTHSEIRSRAGIPTIESMPFHRQLHWLGHVIRMPHSRLPHCMIYGQLRLGHSSVGGQNTRFKDHIKSILKKFNIPFSRLETLASNRATWRSTCAFGMSYFDDEYDRAAALRRSCRHQHAPVLCPIMNSVHQCPLCGRQCFSRIGLLSHSKTHFQR